MKKLLLGIIALSLVGSSHAMAPFGKQTGKNFREKGDQQKVAPAPQGTQENKVAMFPFRPKKDILRLA
jgi:hypothetical protein